MADRSCLTPRVAVLGAGVMGTGIAAHLAGCGFATLLCDIVPKDATPQTRSRLAQEALAKAQKARPAPFFDPDALKFITPGNFDDHLDQIGRCELVIEAVTERLDIKQALFEKLAPALGEHTIVASNTSGLSLKSMSERMPPAVAERFCVMHFFNPVRYMHLVELVAGPKTRSDIISRVQVLSEALGKGVVFGKDTVNFVANRIGVFSMMHAMHAMARHQLSIEEVDKIAGPPLARPQSAAFRTADLVGVDTLAHVAKNCRDHLKQDPSLDVFVLPEWVESMLGRGQLGQKTGAGFYKKEGRDIRVLDGATGSYREQKKVAFDSLKALKGIGDPKARLKTLMAGQDAAAQFAWDNVAATLVYAAGRLGEIADDIVNIDRAMRWGFNWDLGPFEVWDAIGVPEALKRMKAENRLVPDWVDAMVAKGITSFYAEHDGQPQFFDPKRQAYRAVYEGQTPPLSCQFLRGRKQPIKTSNKSASLHDTGDGCWLLEVHTKMNTLDMGVMDVVDAAVEAAWRREYTSLVIGNNGEHFGAGFNLMLLMQAIKEKAWGSIDTMIDRFQQVGQKLRYAPVPTVAAPFQYTFGGALELAMAADACQAHAESYMGLVEAGVGLIPGGGGCLRLLERSTRAARLLDVPDLLPCVGPASLQIATAKVSTGAHDARRLFYLRDSDGISLSQEHLLSDAKARAVGLARAGYSAPVPPVLRAAGADVEATIGMRIWSMQEGRHISEHDGFVAREVARILSGGQRAAGSEMSEQDVLDLERESFLRLCGTEKTQARIESMMLTNTPLRN